MVGRLACRPVSTLSGATGVGLAPVSVTVSHRRQGVAAMLIRDGLSRYRTAGYGSAVVLGEPNYYRRFGFRPAANSAGTKLAGASRERRLTEELVLILRAGQRRCCFTITEGSRRSGHKFVFGDAHPLLVGVRSV